MKKTAEDYLGEPVTEAVITVPAYFGDAQRRGYQDAVGRIARGWKLNVSSTNRPCSAGLQWIKRSRQPYYRGLRPRWCTFDISIIEIDEVDGEKTFEVLATNGDTHGW